MFHLIWKDFLSLSKMPSELFELLLMPFILISILGFALGNALFGESSLETIPVGMVIEQNREEDLANLEEELLEQNYPEEIVAELIEVAEEIDPSQLLIDLMEDEELSDIIEVEEIETREQAESVLEDEEISGVIILPEGFSYTVWTALLLEELDSSSLEIRVEDENSITASILDSVVTNFAHQYNLDSSIAMGVDDPSVIENEEDNEYGEQIVLANEEPINAFQYYTIGMAIMFSLSMAPAISSRAFREKQQHVFGRIMLTGTKPLTFLSSKMAFTSLLTFLQLAILFSLSTLIFGTFSGRTTEFWGNMFLATALYSLFVGSLASLLTSIGLYADNDSGSEVMGIMVSVLAFLGGSFTPIDQFGEGLRTIGSWTPNGASLISYLQIMQGFEWNEVFPLMIRVIGVTVVCLVVAVLLFPKRRLD